ncbi:MAG: CHAT domain-containing protein [Pseudomonadota bacterium]
MTTPFFKPGLKHARLLLIATACTSLSANATSHLAVASPTLSPSLPSPSSASSAAYTQPITGENKPLNLPSLRKIRKASEIMADPTLQDDSKTMLSYITEGKALYQKDSLKLSAYEYCSQAIALSEQGEFRESIRAASKALYLANALNDDTLRALGTRDLAIVYNYIGDLDQAEALAKEALAYPSADAERVKAPSLKVLGDVEARRKHYPEALKHYEEAQKLSSDKFRPLVHSSLIYSLMMTGDLERSRQELEKFPSLKDPNQQAQIKRIQAEWFLKNHEPQKALELFQTLAKSDIGSDTAYFRAWALDGMARAHLDLNQKALAAKTLEQAIHTFESVRAQFRSDEFKMGLFSDVQSVFEHAIALNAELGNAREALAISERSRARALLDTVRARVALSSIATTVLDTETIQKSLGKHEHILAFHALPKELLAWKISQDDIKLISYPLSREDVAKRVTLFQNAIQQGVPYPRAIKKAEASVIKMADELGDLLIKPFAIPAGDALVISPHSALHYLPFQALRQNGHYLMEQHPLSLSPSVSIAIQLANKNTSKRKSLTAFGNPQIALEYRKKYEFDDIPESEEEVKKLSVFFPEKKVFFRTEATKERFKAMTTNSPIIHLATHATVDREDPLHSSIFLAGQNDEGGALEAQEILGLKFENVDLVTLSACESGLGKVNNGDEILGFSRSFLSAGASTFIASLWEVSDEATALLMTQTYQSLSEHANIQSAMQRGQLAVFQHKGMSPPFYWAPFNLMGNWRLTLKD